MKFFLFGLGSACVSGLFQWMTLSSGSWLNGEFVLLLLPVTIFVLCTWKLTFDVWPHFGICAPLIFFLAGFAEALMIYWSVAPLPFPPAYPVLLVDAVAFGTFLFASGRLALQHLGEMLQRRFDEIAEGPHL